MCYVLIHNIVECKNCSSSTNSYNLLLQLIAIIFLYIIQLNVKIVGPKY